MSGTRNIVICELGHLAYYCSTVTLHKKFLGYVLLFFKVFSYFGAHSKCIWWGGWILNGYCFHLALLLLGYETHMVNTRESLNLNQGHSHFLELLCSFTIKVKDSVLVKWSYRSSQLCSLSSLVWISYFEDAIHLFFLYRCLFDIQSW
jgi:hypothetical protein